MYSFLVLGQIPGTNVQISFQAWLVMVAVLPVIILLFIAQHRLRHSARFQALAMRRPLAASQLHQQVQ